MALVITRQLNEGVTITVPPSDKETVICVNNVKMAVRDVRLAFSADESVIILRDELIASGKKKK